MKKKLLALCMTFVLCLSVLAGCGDKGSSSGEESAEFTPNLDTEASVTINIIASMENFESLEAAINDFNEYYPNYEILYTYLENYNSMIAQRLSSDDTVDIFMTNSKIYQSETVAASCLNLLDTDIDLSAIDPQAVNSCTVDGVLYGIPLAHTTYGLVINETLLEEAGISIPTNYEELLAACETLKEAGYVPLQGFSTDGLLGLIRNMFFVQLSSSDDCDETVEALASGEDGCAEIARDEFEILRTLLDDGYIDMSVNNSYEDSYNGTILEFFEGDVPFLIASTETFSGMKKRETKSEHYSSDPFEYSFICAPIGEDDAYYYIENWQVGFSVNTNSAHTEEAVEFMRFLTTEKEINQIAEIKGLPSVAATNTDERFSSIYEGSEENTYVNDRLFPSSIADGLYNACDALGNKNASVDEAIQIMEETLKNGGNK